MSGTERFIGLRVTGPTADWGYIGSPQQRGYTADDDDATPRTLIVYKLGALVGRHGAGNAYFRIGMHNTSSLVPSTVLAYTGEMVASNYYVDPAGGVVHRGNITPIVVVTSNNYGFSLACRSGELSHGMLQAASISGDNENFYDKSLASGSNIPVSLSGVTGANNGHMAVWAEGEENVAPSLPTGLGVTNSLTPTFTSTFNDANKTLNNGQAYDYATSVHILIKEGATTRWDYTYTPTAGVHNHSRAYSGTFDLQYETTYTYQVRHKDRNGLWSGYASTTFVITPTNTKPNKPTGLTPTGSVIGTDMTPLLVANFSDPQETLSTGQAWDYLASYEVKVTRVSDNASMWAPAAFASSSTERTNRKSSREYAGTALAYATQYKYEVRHKDRGGLWSDWASTTFTLTSLSTVAAPTNPKGYETSATDPGSITAVYSHASGLSSNAFEVRLLSSTDSVIKTSPTIAKTVANGATATITWAESTFGTLSLGTTYKIQIRARDTNNVWSADWSPKTTFWINAAPNTPSGLTPSGSTSYSAYPKLICSATDPNTENPTSGLTVKARIKDSGGTVLQTRTMTYNSSTGKFEYQTVAADLPSYATYKWDAYSFDGYHYSGGTTAEASATKSAEAVFVYALGPDVTLTAPTSPISTTTPTVSWSATYSGGGTQQKYRVRLFDPDSGAAVYDTGDVTSTATSTSIQSATNWIGGERWNNGETWDLRVTLTDTNALTGSTADTAITLTYAPIAEIGLLLTPVALPGTHGTNAIAIDIDQTAYDSSEFLSYDLYRVELVGETDTERPGTRIPLKRETNPQTVAFLDADVTSRQRYRYEAFQRIQQGNDEIASPITTAVASVAWDGTILHAPADPTGLVVALRYGALGSPYSPQIALSQPHRLDTPVGGGGRVAHFGRGKMIDPSGDYAIANDDAGSVDDRLRALLALYDAQSGDHDGRPHVLCWREGRGGPLGRVYVVITSEPTVGLAIGGILNISIAFALVSYTLGETV